MRTALITLVASFLAAQSAMADIDITNCPTSAPAGSSVEVEVMLQNSECFEVSFTRALVGIVGNTTDSVAGVGIFGPFPRIAEGSVPAATCNFGFPVFPPEPGTAGPVSVAITGDVPASLVGTVAAMVVSIEVTGTNLMGAKEESEQSDSCLVEVTPAQP